MPNKPQEQLAKKEAPVIITPENMEQEIAKLIADFESTVELAGNNPKTIKELAELVTATDDKIKELEQEQTDVPAEGVTPELLAALERMKEKIAKRERFQRLAEAQKRGPEAYAATMQDIASEKEGKTKVPTIHEKIAARKQKFSRPSQNL